MGLAQRFRDKLDKKNIFEKSQIEKDFEAQDIKFISKPITESITVQPKNLHTGANEPVKELAELATSNDNYKQFEDLETEIIDKIRKTPYWDEYSPERQEHMISSYFDKRCKITYSASERDEFIQNIMALTRA